MITKNDIKGPYSSIIPRFKIPELEDIMIDLYGDLKVAVYPIKPDGIPVVIAVKSDRIHVYVEFEGEMKELKYNAFNKNEYCKLVGPYEEILIKKYPGLVFFGYMYLNRDNPKLETSTLDEAEFCEIFNVWDYARRTWLDVNQILKLKGLGAGNKICIIRHLYVAELGQACFRDGCYFIKGVTDMGLFCLKK